MRPTTWTRRAVALFFAAVVAVAVILLWPEHVDGWFASWVSQLPVEGAWRTAIYETAEAGSNVILFVPVGLFASWWLPRWWLAIVLGAAMSAAFETAQLLLPGRTADFMDVVWNSLGAVLGAVIGAAWVRSRQRRPEASPSSPPSL